jgi:hypothetical protein
MDRLGRLVTALRALLLASVAGGAAGSLPAGPATAQTNRDEADWLAARAEGSQRAFERYLQRHPLGRHASEAFVTVARMSAETGWRPDPGGAAQPEPAAGPTAAADPSEVY